MLFKAVIMAGGKGQRFWPISTEERPKQFLDLERTGRSLLQATFDRLLPLVSGASDLYVATAERYRALVCEQLPELPLGNLILEPEGRDSAPAVALASLLIAERDADALLGFFPADHRIGDAEAFERTVRSAQALAEREQGLVTIGIPPSHPATGYGYLELGEKVGEGYRVAQFVEKPNRRRAEAYLESGRYLWNAGIFVWSAKVILEELGRHSPELLEPLKNALASDTLVEVFPTLPKISIDYAVMERTERALVVTGTFGWDDIGDWVALERLLQRDHQSPNTVVGAHVGLETAGNILYTEDADDVIVTLGIENLVVVKRGNVVLLLHKDRVQDLKTVLADERLAGLKVLS